MTPQLPPVEGRAARGRASLVTAFLLFAVTCGALTYLGLPSYSALSNEGDPAATEDAVGQSLFVRNQVGGATPRANRADGELLVLEEWDPNAVTRGRPA